MNFRHQIDPTTLDIQHDTDQESFKARVEGHTVRLDYYLNNDRMVINDFNLPGPLAGMGIPHELAVRALNYARRHNYRVKVKTPFLRSFVSQHQEYRDLITAMH